MEETKQAIPEETSPLSKLINDHLFIMEHVVRGCSAMIRNVMENDNPTTISAEGFNQFGAEPPLPEQAKPFIMTNAVIMAREIYNRIAERAEKLIDEGG